LQDQHDALRITFTTGAEIVQRNHPERLPLEVPEFDFAHLEDPAGAVTRQSTALQQQIDLAHGPLLKLAIFHLRDGDHLLIVLHHLIVDTVSWGILLEDYNVLLEAAGRGEPGKLPPKSDSYQDWAESLVAYAREGHLAAEARLWDEIERATVDVIPRRSDDPETRYGERGYLSFRLDSPTTEALSLKGTKAYNASVEDFLITGLLQALQAVFGIRRSRLFLEGHGRIPLQPDMDVSRTVGWFTSLYPVVIDLAGCTGTRDAVIRVKEDLRKIPGKGIGWGIRTYLTGDGPGEFPQAQVVFNYLGQFGGEPANRSFTLSAEDSGENVGKAGRSSFPVEVSGLVNDEGLAVFVSYDRQQLDPAGMEALLLRYEVQMRELADHCAEMEREVLTPSDLGCNELSVEEISEIEKFFGT
jgi:non-ribosomal peptide synthase protein (TIGR01720 family)